MMELSLEGKQYIRQQTPRSFIAFRNHNGHWSIGYNRLHNVKEGDVITREIARDWFSSDISRAERIANWFIGDTVLPQERFDALVKLVFDFGINKIECGVV